MVATTALRILVVDDYPDTGETLVTLLGLGGHEVRTVGDGTAALELCKAWVPDLILLDIVLPGMDGYQVARSIRATPALAETTIIAVTGQVTAKDRRMSADAGIHFHLVKPVDHRFLDTVIGDITERKTARTTSP